MAVYLHGFPIEIADRLAKAGIEIACAVAPDASQSQRAFPVVADAERFAFQRNSFSADMPKALADEMRRDCWPLFNRSHVREFFRQNSGRPDWIEISNYFENAVQHFYRELTERQVNTVLFNIMPHEGSTPVLFELARRMGINVAYCSHIGSAPGTFWIAETLQGLGASPIAAPEQPAYARFEIDENPKSPFYMRSVVSGSSWRWAKLLLGAGASLAGRALILQFVTNPRAFAKKALKFEQARGLYRHQHALRERYQTEIPKGDFVYFPLHLQPESTTDILGGDYADQLLAVEELARALPEGLSIVVKENPKQGVAMRGEAFFDRIAAIPSVTLLHASVSTYELMARSKLVASICGTAGWEAIQTGKPTVIFGGAWFQGLPGVFDWRADGPEALTRALDYQHDAEALRAAVAERSKRLWPGVVDLVYARVAPEFDAARNTTNVANSLLAYLAARKSS